MPTLDAAVIPDLPIYQFSVDQYYEMIRSGVLNADDRTELLNGWMVLKMSNNPPHSAATELTAETLRRSTLRRDRQIKKQIYADAGIPCYWIVDVMNRQVEVHTKPNGQAYDNVELYTDCVPFQVGDAEPQMIRISDLIP